MPSVNTYLYRSVTLLQQRGLAKLKEIPTPYPVKSFGTESIPQETYMQWVSSTGIRQQAHVAFVKAKLHWFSHWGNLAEMNAIMPEFNEKLEIYVQINFMIKEWSIKNYLKPTPEQLNQLNSGGFSWVEPKPISEGKKQQILNGFYKDYAVAQKGLEANGYGPFDEMPPQPWLALLGLANIATLPKNASLQGVADDAAVMAYLQRHKDLWLGIPANWGGVLVNI
jgi:hypothetical protein